MSHTLAGNITCSVLYEVIGHCHRKYTILINNIVIWIGALLEFFAAHPYMLIAGRFVVGINCGVNTVLAPMYITELAPVRIRGNVGVLHQLAITVGLLVSQILGISEVSKPWLNACIVYGIL